MRKILGLVLFSTVASLTAQAENHPTHSSLLGKSLDTSTLHIQGRSLFVPSRLGKVKLSHDKSEFHVLQNSTHHDVQSCWIDPTLKNIRRKHLAAFLANGYISVNQMDGNEFSLKAHVRGLGGKEITGKIVAYTIRAVGAGTILRDIMRRLGAEHWLDIFLAQLPRGITVEDSARKAEEFFTGIQWLP